MPFFHSHYQNVQSVQENQHLEYQKNTPNKNLLEQLSSPHEAHPYFEPLLNDLTSHRNVLQASADYPDKLLNLDSFYKFYDITP